MTYINIGQSDKHQVKIDLDILLKTRLLIQANSGGGKSWLIRRLVEQAFGKIQIIIIDPEGEFPSLREKFDFVLVGQGGETPADVRSAALVAHKLLELKVSAVCDLFEMKSGQRHEWVKTFLDTMIDAPKNLWHPVLVVVDEAHTFAPEKGEGESVASGSMIDLSSKGRKRGFCAVFATQRLAKMRKDATAEMLNRLVGPTFEEADLDRAAKLLSILPTEKHTFFEEMKVLEPGNFYALGRAISKTRIMVEVGNVETTHPEVGSQKFTAAPPPPRDKIKALLPQLSDLPQEAEKKARTEAELRQKIIQLERELRQRPTTVVPEIRETKVEVPVMDQGVLDSITKLNELITTVYGLSTEALAAAKKITARPSDYAQVLLTNPAPRAQGSRQADFRTPVLETRLHGKIHGKEGPFRTKDVVQGPDQFIDSSHLSGPEQRILNALAWWNVAGFPEATNQMVAPVAGYSWKGSAYTNPRGSLNTKGLIQLSNNSLRLTESGNAKAEFPTTPATPEEMQSRALAILPGPERRILTVLLRHYPNAISNEVTAAEAEYSPDGSAYTNPRGKLSSLGFITYPNPGWNRAASFLFLE